jgi:hypothetical protein
VERGVMGCCVQATTIILDRRVQFAALEMRVAFLEVFQCIASLGAVSHLLCSWDTEREKYSPGIEAVLIPFGVLCRRQQSTCGERWHDITGEPAKLLLELSRRQAFRPVDHVVLQAGIFRLDRFDAVYHLTGCAAEPRFLNNTITQ